MSPAAAAAGGGERRRPIASGRDGRSRGGGCGGPAGAALLGLSLFGLVLYLVPAAAALAWLAVGATAAWWGLSREPRGSRALSSLVRNARRQRTLHASPPAKSAVNGNLLEPRSLLEGPDPAELLLMGSYLGKPGPPQPAPAPEARDLLERPGRRRTPARAAPPAPSAHRVHHIYPSLPTPLLRSSRRPSLRDCGSLSHRFVITPRRRYPIQQAQYSLLGVLPTVCWNGYHKKAVLSPRNSKMVCSPVTVRIAPPDSKWTRSPIPEQTINSTLSSPSSNAPDPCAKETVLSALKERKKRTVEEEDQIFSDSQENKRRRHDSSGSGHSAFEPLVANGVPAAFVPKPGSLKRGLNSQSSDDPSNKRSRTSSVSSLTSTYTGGIPSSSRNAITSSYSSTRGFSQLWKRSGPSSSPFSSPASSRSQTPERPAKKIREDELSHRSSSSTPLATDKEAPGEKAADTSTWKAQTSCSSPPTPGSSGRRRRRVQLLPSRRGARLTLPPPPQLGYSITAEDLDLEKRASLQWFNKALADGTETASSSVAEKPPATQPSLTCTLPAAGTAASPATLPAPCSSPLLESLKKMQSCAGLSSAPESTGVATTVAPLPPKTPSLLAPLGSSQSGPLPGTSSDSKNAATFLGLTPAASPTPATDTTRSPPAPQAETSAKSPAPAARSPTPKESLLLGMLSTPPADPPASAAPAVSSASPMFKPIFAAPPKSENESPLPSSPSKVPTTAPSSSALPAPASSPQPTFKPVFGSMGPPTSAPLSAPFFGQTAAPATATSGPLFAGQATAASAVAPVAPASTASTSADSASKPTFSFGVSGVTSTTTSAAAPFLFGAPPASSASFSPAVGSVFQFGKPPAAPASTAVTTFGQSVPGAAQTAAGSGGPSGFGGFGGGLTAPAPATSSPPALTFTTAAAAAAPAFHIPFGSSPKPAPPSYPGANPQPAFGAANGQQQGPAKPAVAPGFGSSFAFANSAAPAPAATPAPGPAQPAFGSAAQSAFGGLKPAASAFGTAASTQPAFGSGTPVFSFGAATTAGFGATTQTTSSGTSGSVFGGTTLSPFTFGGSAGAAGGGSFGINVAAPGTSGAFSFGTGQSGSAGGTTPFGGGLSQSTLGAPSQSTPFAFSVAGTPESKPVFGGTSTPTFGQNTPAPGVGASGSGLSFGASSTPTQGFVGVGHFGKQQVPSVPACPISPEREGVSAGSCSGAPLPGKDQPHKPEKDVARLEGQHSPAHGVGGNVPYHWKAR
ncbi:nuclear envelope pore membrane protein POM 121C-like isoform X1 [Mirounga leonina]|uniref:nuclear envelope pore membrane protein POM 121C-like isoform X1 n=2 Tax=Mirounga leonina TaxID=9715 RepID=UPI00156C4415|nr:nuclear envelope pore membrane protein POM 121C-like isoform X1 [Mirounga leonina]